MPRYVEELVKIYYWKCNVPSHRHQSKSAGSSCMIKNKGTRGEILRTRRNLLIIRALIQRVPCSEIALQAKCSASNLLKAANSSLVKSYEFSEQNGGCPFARKSWQLYHFSMGDRAKELQFLVGVLEQYLLVMEAGHAS